MTTLVEIAPTIAKLLRLLASDKPGEVTAAVHALRRVLNSAGLDLHDLADVIKRDPFGMVPMPRGTDNPLDMIRVCFRNADGLSTKELKIVNSVADWCREPTKHQMSKLRPLYRRCMEAEHRKAESYRKAESRR